MTDFLLLEQLHRIIKEIPKPRLLFRKGIAASGFFRPYMSLADYTAAQMFSGAGVVTPVKVRFSAMLGDDGTADTVRNIKKLEIKFLSRQGEYDMICHSIPVQFINDKDKLQDMFGMFCRRRWFDGINTEAFWQFVIENPEALNAAIHLFSHEGLSDSYTDINWYSVNIAAWRNSKGEECSVRYKWQPVYSSQYGRKPADKLMSRNEAEFIAGFDPDRAGNGLAARIDDKNYPAFELYVQMIDSDDTADSRFFNHTLLWDDRKVPFMSAGIMMLDKVYDESDDISGETFFSPDNTVPGIMLHRDELVDTIGYMYRIEAMERGMTETCKSSR